MLVPGMVPEINTISFSNNIIFTHENELFYYEGVNVACTLAFISACKETGLLTNKFYECIFDK